MPCRNCSGTGITAASVICQRCSGTGEIIIYDSDGTERMQLCPKCEDGMVYIEQTCSTCKGTGEILPLSS
jgi:DnaJ-class molecular chaperone